MFEEVLVDFSHLLHNYSQLQVVRLLNKTAYSTGLWFSRPLFVWFVKNFEWRKNIVLPMSILCWDRRCADMKYHWLSLFYHTISKSICVPELLLQKSTSLVGSFCLHIEELPIFHTFCWSSPWMKSFSIDSHGFCRAQGFMRLISPPMTTGFRWSLWAKARGLRTWNPRGDCT